MHYPTDRITHTTAFVTPDMGQRLEREDSQRGNLLSPLHRLLFPISSMVSFICTIPQTGQHISQIFLYQLWNTGWKKIYISVGRPWRSDPMTYYILSRRCTTKLHLAPRSPLSSRSGFPLLLSGDLPYNHKLNMFMYHEIKQFLLIKKKGKLHTQEFYPFLQHFLN